MNENELEKRINDTCRIIDGQSKALPLIIALDGRAAAGKTTLAYELKKIYDCNVFHVDDFFLRPEQRTAERLAEIGGNFDRERMLKEVIEPLLSGVPFSYRPYSCKLGALTEPIEVEPKKITVIEGSYACHPCLFNIYGLRFFLTVDKEEQLRRISKRAPMSYEAFKTKWIPLEEAYFEKFDISSRCDAVI